MTETETNAEGDLRPYDDVKIVDGDEDGEHATVLSVNVEEQWAQVQLTAEILSMPTSHLVRQADSQKSTPGGRATHALGELERHERTTMLKAESKRQVDEAETMTQHDTEQASVRSKPPKRRTATRKPSSAEKKGKEDPAEQSSAAAQKAAEDAAATHAAEKERQALIVSGREEAERKKGAQNDADWKTQPDAAAGLRTAPTKIASPAKNTLPTATLFDLVGYHTDILRHPVVQRGRIREATKHFTTMELADETGSSKGVTLQVPWSQMLDPPPHHQHHRPSNHMYWMIVYQSDQHVLRASVITVDQITGLLHAGYRGTLQLDDGKAATPAVGLRSGSARTSPPDANLFSVLGDHDGSEPDSAPKAETGADGSSKGTDLKTATCMVATVKALFLPSASAEDWVEGEEPTDDPLTVQALISANGDAAKAANLLRDLASRCEEKAEAAAGLAYDTSDDEGLPVLVHDSDEEEEGAAHGGMALHELAEQTASKEEQCKGCEAACGPGCGCGGGGMAEVTDLGQITAMQSKLAHTRGGTRGKRGGRAHQVASSRCADLAPATVRYRPGPLRRARHAARAVYQTAAAYLPTLITQAVTGLSMAAGLILVCVAAAAAVQVAHATLSGADTHLAMFSEPTRSYVQTASAITGGIGACNAAVAHGAHSNDTADAGEPRPLHCAECGSSDGGMLDEMLACPECGLTLCAECFPPIAHAPCSGVPAPPETTPPRANTTSPRATAVGEWVRGPGAMLAGTIGTLAPHAERVTASAAEASGTTLWSMAALLLAHAAGCVLRLAPSVANLGASERYSDRDARSIAAYAVLLVGDLASTCQLLGGAAMGSAATLCVMGLHAANGGTRALRAFARARPTLLKILVLCVLTGCVTASPSRGQAELARNVGQSEWDMATQPFTTQVLAHGPGGARAMAFTSAAIDGGQEVTGVLDPPYIRKAKGASNEPVDYTCGRHAFRTLVDSGGSTHFFNQRWWFPNELLEPSAKLKVHTASAVLTPTGVGTAVGIARGDDGELKRVIMPDSLYVPQFECNLMSVSKMVDRSDCTVTFSSKDEGCAIRHPNNVTLPFAPAWRNGGVYVIELRPQHGMGHTSPEAAFAAMASPCDADALALVAVPKLITVGRGIPKDAPGRAQLLHECFGHRKGKGLANLHKVCLRAPKVSTKAMCGCEVCAVANMRRKHSQRDALQHRREWGHFSSDKIGPVAPSWFGGYIYLWVATELSTGYVFIYPMRCKSEEPEMRNRLETDVAALPGLKRVRSHRTDGCGEAWSATVTAMCDVSNTQMASGRAYEHNSMSVAENVNCTLGCMARGNLTQCGLGNEFGVDAMIYAARQHNMIPNEWTGYESSPYMLAHDGAKPDAGDCGPFGCEIICHRNESERAQGDKFSARGEAGIFLGVDPRTGGAKAMLERRTLPKSTKNAVLNVTRYPTLANLGRMPGPAPAQYDKEDEDGGDGESESGGGESAASDGETSGDEAPAAPRRPTRERTAPNRLEPNATGPAPAAVRKARAQPRPRCLVPAALWPAEVCTENDGLGWTAEITGVKDGGAAVRVRFLNARTADGSTFKSEWIQAEKTEGLPAERVPTPFGAVAWDAPDVDEYEGATRYFYPSCDRTLSGGGSSLDAHEATAFFSGAFSVTELDAAEEILMKEVAEGGDLTAIVYGTAKVPRSVGELRKWAEEERAPWMAAIGKEFKTLTEHNGKKPAALTRMTIDKVPRGTRFRRMLIKLTAKKADSLKGDRAKARAVVDGSSEVKGHDYRTTSSYTLRTQCAKLCLCKCAAAGWQVWHSDLPTAYTWAEPEPGLPTQYLRVPEAIREYEMGSDGKLHEVVYRVDMSLYGQHAAPNRFGRHHAAWHTKNGGEQCYNEPGLTYYKCEDGEAVCATYVDDALWGFSNPAIEKRLKEAYARDFNAEFAEASRYLNLDLTVDNEHRHISFSQPEYVESVYEQYMPPDHPLRSRPATVPATRELTMLTSPAARACYPPSDEALTTLNRALLGCMLYHGYACKPEILLPVCTLAQGAGNPTEMTYNLLLQVLSYAHETRFEEMHISGEAGLEPVAMCDANHAVDCAMAGWAIAVCGCCVAFACRRERCVALSTVEAELVAASMAAADIVYVRSVLEFMNVPLPRPTPLGIDNAGAAAIATDPVMRSTLKHVARRHYYVRDCVEEGYIAVYRVGTADNVADIMTKPLPAERHRVLAARLRSSIGQAMQPARESTLPALRAIARAARAFLNT